MGEYACRRAPFDSTILIIDDEAVALGLLHGWGERSLQSGVTFSGGNSAYCAGGAARATMTSSPNTWTITDGGTHYPSYLLWSR